MRTAPNPDSQRRNQRDYLSFRPISAFLPAVFGILIAIFGTAWTFTLAFKPQQVAKPTTSSKTALKSHIAQPRLSKPLTNTLKQSSQPVKEVEGTNTETREHGEFSRSIAERLFASLSHNAPTQSKVVSSSAIAPNSNSVNLLTLDLLHKSLKPLPNPPLKGEGVRLLPPETGGLIAKRDVVWGANSTFARGLLCNLALFSPIGVQSAQPLEHKLTLTPTESQHNNLSQLLTQIH
jgi:hypothetical protein